MKLGDLFDVTDIKGLPMQFVDTFTPSNMRAKGYPWWTRGDTSAFIALFFDNLATQLGLIGMAVEGFGEGKGACPTIAYNSLTTAGQCCLPACRPLPHTHIPEVLILLRLVQASLRPSCTRTAWEASVSLSCLAISTTGCRPRR